MNIHLIKTNEDYEKALAEIGTLLNSQEGSQEAEKLEILSILVEDYEDKNFQIEMPDPIETIKYIMEQSQLSNKDLVPSIGSSGRVSEVLNYKRNLTLPMIRRLNKHLNIPAEILTKEPKKKKSA